MLNNTASAPASAPASGAAGIACKEQQDFHVRHNGGYLVPTHSKIGQGMRIHFEKLLNEYGKNQLIPVYLENDTPNFYLNREVKSEETHRVRVAEWENHVQMSKPRYEEEEEESLESEIPTVEMNLKNSMNRAEQEREDGAGIGVLCLSKVAVLVNIFNLNRRRKREENEQSYHILREGWTKKSLHRRSVGAVSRRRCRRPQEK